MKSLMCAAEEWRLIRLVELMKVFCVMSQFEDRPVNSSERFGSEYDDETNKEVLNLNQ